MQSSFLCDSCAITLFIAPSCSSHSTSGQQEPWCPKPSAMPPRASSRVPDRGRPDRWDGPNHGWDRSSRSRDRDRRAPVTPPAAVSEGTACVLRMERAVLRIERAVMRIEMQAAGQPQAASQPRAASQPQAARGLSYPTTVSSALPIRSGSPFVPDVPDEGEQWPQCEGPGDSNPPVGCQNFQPHNTSWCRSCRRTWLNQQQQATK